MSKLAEKQPKLHLSKNKRLTKLIAGMLEGKTFGQIAEECGCSYHTVERDFWEWRDNGGFDKWLQTEFMRLHNQETRKEEGDAYKVVADLLKKRMKEQIEQTIAGKLDLTLDSGKDIAGLLAKYETLFEGMEKTVPPENSPPKQVDTTQTNTETS